MISLPNFKCEIRGYLLKHRRLSWLERPSRMGRYLFHQTRCALNRTLLWSELLRSRKYVHLGCGDQALTGAINVDSRATSATDVRRDCKSLDIFPGDHFVGVVSNAFWEHVFLNDRQRVVDEAYRIIRCGGFALFLGIPDFERVAQAYLNKERGITAETFDLSQVYRFTHGEPESTPDWWFGNLHKSLFDADTVLSALRSAGFTSWILFRYGYESEAVPGQLGFLAYKGVRMSIDVMSQQLRDLLRQFRLAFVNLRSLEVLNIS